nr:MAG: Putative amidase domain [Bacteriophage sp.]
MAITFAQWIDQTKNRFWDMDGAYGAQCWDLWAKYSMDMYGMSIQDCITPTGYAGGLYTAYPVSARCEQVYERIPADGYSPVAGDVAIWGYSTYTPYTHVAIVAADGVKDEQIYVITQNPDASALKRFPTIGLLGYLHPRTMPKPDANNPTGDNNQGNPDTSRGGAWIHWQGDNLYLHETDNTGTRTRIFYRTTANNFSEKASQSQPSDSQGQGHPSSSVSTENSYALYVVGTVESGLRWDAVEAANLQGIGIAQWSFERRLQVLNAMKTADPTGYEAFKTAAPEIAALMESGGTFKRSLTSAEAAAFRTWAARNESRDGQRKQFAEDYAGYPKEYADTKMQILWVTAYHQSPANALKVPKASNLAQLKNNILATYPFGPYTNRYNQAYSLLSVWDGKSNPPAF